MQVTISDVAKEAKVGTTTVSRVLNNAPYVSEEKRKKVEETIEKLGYSRNWVARSLVRQKTNLIGVIVPQVNLSFYSSILTVMEEVSFTFGYNLFICITMHNPKKEFESITLCKEMKVDGLILMNEQLSVKTVQFISEWDVPVISVSGEVYHTSIPSVLVNDYHASMEMTNYVIKHLHKKIAYLAGNNKPHATLDSRVSGFLHAIEKSKEVIQYVIDYGDYSFQSGYQAMERVWKKDSKVTAVIAISDDVAIGAMNFLQDQGVSVPEDVSLVGFDGSDVSTYCRPRLTTIQQPIQLMGEKSIELLIQMIQGETIENKTIVPFKLFKGASCMTFQNK